MKDAPQKISSQKEPENYSLADKKLALQICSFLGEKKAQRIVLLDLHKINPYFNYFLIASTNSVLHLSSLAQEINKCFAKSSKNAKSSPKKSYISPERQNLPLRDSHSGWVILDLVDIVVHLFLEEQRSFYNLERLWGDADIIYP